MIARMPPDVFGLTDDPLWYKDAIIYELHVRTFYDSDGDGVGDFLGLTQRLDYLQDLGVTALWLLPFCLSLPLIRPIGSRRSPEVFVTEPTHVWHLHHPALAWRLHAPGLGRVLAQR